VQQVRTRLHDSIQSLHGTMPLWGIDNWVPLGDLFVDVNILEETSSNRRSELDDLWQDFTTGNSNYHSLDRIGLGNQQQRVSGLSVLERNTNLMVVGKPGSGKTTYLQRIVTECNNGKLQAQRIPVLIKLREFVDDGRKYGYNLEQFLGQLWRLSNADIELVLNQGKALVLLDGLDEVTGEAGKQITKEIKRFARVYPQVLVVVTCRTQSQESRFQRFDYVEVADFNEEQVRTFAEHWFGTVCEDEGEKQAREFLEQLLREENKPIRELAITPILLSLTCAVFQQTGKFYSKRSKLYEEGLELLLVQWDKSREVQRDEVYRDLSVERKLELLSYVAVKKFEQEQYVLFEQEELEGYIGEFLGIERRESQGVLRAIASQHGLLIERSHKVWSFSHLTFQEYLVAKLYFIFLNNPELTFAQLRMIAQQFPKYYWAEVFSLLCDMTWDDKLLRQLYEKINTLIVHDKKIQNFLCWVKKKCIYNKDFYKPAAIRAFYFICSELLEIDMMFHLSRDIGIGFGVDFDIDLDRFIIFFLQCNKLEIENIRNIFGMLIRFILIPNYKHLKIIKCLKEILLPLYDSYSNMSLEEFININNIENIAINERDIGHKWEFSQAQLQLLNDYYNANRLIVFISERSDNLTNNVKEGIELTLLLPSAEI
jgi:predicted NACHT family NTPase